MAVSNPTDKNGNTIPGCFVANIIPGLIYRWILNENIYLFPKIGPSVNIFITPGTEPGASVGFGISPQLGLRIKRLELGIISNVSIASPISFSNWVGFEAGLNF
jgi:hypothetical protein